MPRSHLRRVPGTSGAYSGELPVDGSDLDLIGGRPVRWHLLVVADQFETAHYPVDLEHENVDGKITDRAWSLSFELDGVRHCVGCSTGGIELNGRATTVAASDDDERRDLLPQLPRLCGVTAEYSIEDRTFGRTELSWLDSHDPIIPLTPNAGTATFANVAERRLKNGPSGPES